MVRLLIRAHKSPTRVVDAETTLRKNLIGDNAGNLIFSQAVCRLLSTTDSEIETNKLPPSTKITADEINAEYDALVLPLANAFRQSFLPGLEALTDLIEGLKIPVTVLGVGVQDSLDGESAQPDRVHEQARRFVAAVLDRSPSLGVRGEHTRDYLGRLGFGEDHVRVIGCPSMFWDGPRLQVTKKTEGLGSDSAIALNVTPYVADMGSIVEHNAERYPRLVYIPQDIATLRLLVRGRYDGPGDPSGGLPITLEHPLLDRDRIRFFLDPATWISHLTGYDFSFGTRIHGNIAALLSGTPAVLLAHDSRTLELARYHQIPHRMISEVGQDTDAAELYSEADWQPMLDGHADRFATFANFLADQQLSHVFQPGQSPVDFDTDVADTDYPPAVRTLRGLDLTELYALKDRADDRQRLAEALRAEQRARAEAEQRTQAEAEQRTQAEAERNLARSTAPIARLRRVRKKIRRRLRRLRRRVELHRTRNH